MFVKITKKLNMNLNIRLLRYFVLRRQNQKIAEYDRAMKNLTVEQVMTFNRVKDLAVANNSMIKFDPKTNEILIDLSHILIIIKGNKVYIQNSTVFHIQEFYSNTIDFLRDIIEREAHRDRCKLKHEAKQRIRSLLTSMGAQEKDIDNYNEL